MRAVQNNNNIINEIFQLLVIHRNLLPTDDFGFLAGS